MRDTLCGIAETFYGYIRKVDPEYEGGLRCRFVGVVPRKALRPQPAAEDMAASSAAAAMAASAAAAASEDEFRQDGPVAQRIAACMPYYKFKGM